MKKPTIHDVAALSGVSISSISRYLADNASIKPQAARKVAEAIEQLNYIPNAFASNLRNGNSNVIGLVQPDISQDLFTMSMKILNQSLSQHNYLLITCDTNNNPERERNQIKALIRQNVECIIVITCGHNTSYLDEVAKSYGKLIIANRPEPTIETHSYCEDQVKSGYRLAKYMIEKGKRNFQIIGGVSYSGATVMRVQGFKNAFEEFGIPFDDSMVKVDCVDFDSSFKASEIILGEYPETDCILFTNQRSSDAIIRAVECVEPDKNHPAIAGFTSKNNLYHSKTKFPCIMEDTIEIANYLADFVMKCITKTPMKPQKVLFYPPLVDIDGGYVEKFSFDKV